MKVHSEFKVSLLDIATKSLMEGQVVLTPPPMIVEAKRSTRSMKSSCPEYTGDDFSASSSGHNMSTQTGSRPRMSTS